MAPTFCRFFVAVAVGLAILEVIDCRSIDPRCQAMRIPWCMGVYDAVIFPNFVGHHTQEDAYYAMHRLWPLIKSECSPQILHYLCRLFAPQCPFFTADRDSSYVSYHPEQYRPPCEDACLKVRHDCHHVLVEHEIHWPTELECHKLRNASCIETPQIEVEPRGRFRVLQETTTPQMIEITTSEFITTMITQEPVTESTEATTIQTPVETTTELEDTTTQPTTTVIEVVTEEMTTETATESTTEEEPESTSTEETTTEPTLEAATEEMAETTTEMETTTIEITEPETEEASSAASSPEPIATDATTGSLIGINPVIQEDTSPSGEDGESEEADAITTTVAAPEGEPEAGVRAAFALPVEGHSTSEEGKASPESEQMAPADPAMEKAADGDLSSTHGEGDPAAQSSRSGKNAGHWCKSDTWRARMMIIYLAFVSVVYRYIA